MPGEASIHPVMGHFGGACRGATPPVLAAPDYRRRRLRAGGGPGSASPAKVAHYHTSYPPTVYSHQASRLFLIGSRLGFAVSVRKPESGQTTRAAATTCASFTHRGTAHSVEDDLLERMA